MLKNHVFQFDFLNDDFNKLPQSLQEIIKDIEMRVSELLTEKQKSEKVLNEGSTTLNINPDDAEANKFLKEIQENIV